MQPFDRLMGITYRKTFLAVQVKNAGNSDELSNILMKPKSKIRLPNRNSDCFISAFVYLRRVNYEKKSITGSCTYHAGGNVFRFGFCGGQHRAGKGNSVGKGADFRSGGIYRI